MLGSAPIMPDYIAPGVYVEETGSPPKSIAGVSTTTTAFVGPTRFGPVGLAPGLVTSYAEFERSYGGCADLGFAPALNHIAHGVRAYFAEGGKQLYVARVAGKSKTAASPSLVPGKTSRFVARFPGAAGNGRITIQLAAPPASLATASLAVDGSLLLIKTAPPLLVLKQKGRWCTGTGAVRALTGADEIAGMELLTVQVTTLDADGHSNTYADLGFDSHHPRYLGAVLKKNPAAPADQLSLPFAFDVISTVKAFELFAALAPAGVAQAKVIALSGGTDVAPTLADYTKAFALLANLPDVSIVAAPGHTAFPVALAAGVASQLVAHAEQLKYRIAVLDPPASQDIAAVQTYGSRFKSTFAALYYPWIVTANPAFDAAVPGSSAEILLPPSAFICGIYVRNDITAGVFKSPANAPISSALRLERAVTEADQNILNPLGINCLRFFPGKGNLIWGARTTSAADMEWRYVSVRRYFIYLERSIDLGTQWVVFEPNAEPLWLSVRGLVENFLSHEWKSGALAGISPKEAFFVKCDRTTMSQNDLDNGQLICEIGVAPQRPAEFIIFRIGQKTAGT